MISIKDCTITDLENQDNFINLINEYSIEGAVLGMPAPKVNLAEYHTREAQGLWKAAGAFLEDGTLVGFITVGLVYSAHYGVTLAGTESYFVSAEARSSGAGLKLLRKARDIAKDHNAPGLVVTALEAGPLCKILPALGGTETHRTYFLRGEHVTL